MSNDLTVADAKPHLRLPKTGNRLLDGFSLLLDLGLGLFEPDPSVARVEPHQHAAFLHIAADVEIDLDDLARNVGATSVCSSLARLPVASKYVGIGSHDGLRRS